MGLDPNVLFANPEQIRAEVTKTLDSFGTHTVESADAIGHVFNLGHGISQFTPPEAVSVLVDAVHTYSRQQRKR